MEYRVLHEDERVIVLDKPSGLLSVPGRGPDKADCLAGRVQREHPGARVVHRLDQPTSGVIVMALDPEAQRHLGRQFEERRVAKRYVAVVHGTVADGDGRIELPIRLDVENRPLQIVDHVHGRPAVTSWRVASRTDGCTRLEIHPLTGRSHQIRLHLSAIGHPILGDDLYAPPPVRAMTDRLLLHAEMLRFDHPGTGRPLTIESPCPF